MDKLEIKTLVGARRLGPAVHLSKSDLVRCDVGDELFHKHIPREHMAQILHQLLVVEILYSLYASAGETGLLYCVLMRCIPELRCRCLDVLKAVPGPVVA